MIGVLPVTVGPFQYSMLGVSASGGFDVHFLFNPALKLVKPLPVKLKLIIKGQGLLK